MHGTMAGGDPLPSWNEGANKKRITDFVRAVTTPGSKDYVAPADRIAVFDQDGTLWLEYPLYTQVYFVFDRIRAMAPQHPEWKDKEPYKSVIAGDIKGAMAGGTKALFELLLVAQSGSTTEEFAEMSKKWIAASNDARFKRPYTDLTYQPMQELLRYLQANGFKNYIVSGGSVEFMRGFTEAVYGLPNEQVIGTRQKYAYDVASGKPMVKMLPELDFNDDGPGKPANIAAIIGKRPIAAFGNSDGDFQMLQWTTAGSGARLGMIVHHDDAAREYAYDRDSSIGRLAEGLDKYQSMGWGLISMKNDWKVIFPPAK
jgi:phosphoglycolate phosphatase-like HAD superfamily hydrolase